MKYWLIPAALSGLLALAGCGTPSSQPQGPASQPAGEHGQSHSTGATGIKDGASRMRTQLQSLQKALAGGDLRQVKEAAKELEETWESFEDRVKSSAPDFYSKVEDPLGILTAGSKAESLDKQTLTDAAAKLDAVLKQLEEKN